LLCQSPRALSGNAFGTSLQVHDRSPGRFDYEHSGIRFPRYDRPLLFAQRGTLPP
jgi:hypothetical protein